MLHVAHDATHPQHLWLIGTPGRDRRRLRVQVRTQSKSIECSFNVVSIVLPQCRFNVVYSADRPSVCSSVLGCNVLDDASVESRGL